MLTDRHKKEQRLLRALFMAACALMMGLWTSQLAYGQSININAKASVLMETESGRVLMEHQAHEKLAPASVTKVMTMLLIYEALDQERIKWDDKVTVSEHAASMGGSQIYLESEEQQLVRDLVKSIVIASANDAAVAMAEYVAGSEEAFVQMMNSKAESLGMKDTHFVNACGLDAAGHITSAYDIAVMSRELITKYPTVFDYTKIRLDKITHKTARGEEEFGLTNTNRLIRSYSGATGLKTGSTSDALYCISATAEKEGMALIAVILGAPDPTTRFDSAMKLLDYGYANYAVIAKDAAGSTVGNIKIYKGEKESVAVVVKAQTKVLVPKGKHVVIDQEIKIDESLNAPVDKNAKAGEIIYTCEGKEVGRSELIVPETINRASPQDIMERVFSRWMFKSSTSE